MAKTQRSNGYSIYPYKGNSTGKGSTIHYINIRAIKDEDNYFDVGVYLENGERVKCEKKYWVDHEVKTAPNKDEINDRIGSLIIEIKRCIDNGLRTKDEVEPIIYPNGLASKAKNQRVKHLVLPVKTQEVKDEFKVLYNPIFNFIKKHFPADTDLQTLSERITFNLIADETIQKLFARKNIDLIQAIDYAKKHYPFISDLKIFKQVIESKKKYPQLIVEAQEFLKWNELYTDNTVFNHPTVDYITLNKTETNKFKDAGGDIKDVKEVQKFIDSNKSNKNSTPEERYSTSDYNKNDIFEVCGQILFTNNRYKRKRFSDHWQGLVRNLFQYKALANPKSRLSDLNSQWIIDFLTWLKDVPHPTKGISNFNPFQYEINAKHFKESPVDTYNDISLKKKVKTTREVFSYLIGEKALPAINFKEINYEMFNLDNVNEQVRTDWYLKKEEIDQLFYFEFKDGKFKKKEFEQARDLFILQFWFGGLRNNVELLRQDEIIISDDHKTVTYMIGKDSNESNENPICSYSDIVLKKYGYDFSKIKMDSKKYLDITKEIGQLVFNRKVKHIQQVDGKRKTELRNLKDIFTPYWARHTFEQILRDNGVAGEDRKEFTGRSKGNGSDTHYSSNQKKRELMEKIKPVKSKKTT